MKIHYQKITGDDLNRAIKEIDYEYYPYYDPEPFHKMITRYIMDVRYIHFEERFTQYPINGNWMSGMYTITSEGMNKWITAYGHTPEEAVGRVFVRSHYGDMIEVEYE